jgi:hypothetical protein
MAVTLAGPVSLAAAPILTAVTNAGAASSDRDLVGQAQHNAMLVAVGSILATASVILALLALNATTGAVTPTTAVPWIITLLVCGAVVGLICVFQQRLWLRAANAWGAGVPNGGERISWVLHVVSYPVVVVGLFAGIAASQAVGFAGAVANWSTLAVVPLIASQVVGAVRYVRRSGPPGTIPAHLRALAARIERSRHED